MPFKEKLLENKRFLKLLPQKRALLQEPVGSCSKKRRHWFGGVLCFIKKTINRIKNINFVHYLKKIVQFLVSLKSIPPLLNGDNFKRTTKLLGLFMPFYGLRYFHDKTLIFNRTTKVCFFFDCLTNYHSTFLVLFR